MAIALVNNETLNVGKTAGEVASSNYFEQDPTIAHLTGHPETPARRDTISKGMQSVVC